jgi:CDP-diacylglycerol--glycerol-3-phosphate 3-phosphatidyltransferase
MATETKRTARILPKQLDVFVNILLDQCASLLVRLKFTPNFITFLAFLTGGIAGAYFASDKPFTAALLILLCGSFDILDGKVAKLRDLSSQFGAMLDSVLDRYSEFFLYLGLAYYFRDHWALWITFFALLGSTMVSYTRARAEGLGFECRVGIMQRAERMGLLALAGLIGPWFQIFDPMAITALILIAVVSNFTACQRMVYIWKVEKRQQQDT